MSNYNSLKTTINANVKQNGVQAITGQILNEVLNEMVNTLGAGYQFAGVATTATNPGTPDAKVFYIANGKGTYTNFGNLKVTEDEVVVLYWDTAWHKEATGIASQENIALFDNVKILSGWGDDVSVIPNVGDMMYYVNPGSDVDKKILVKTYDGGINVYNGAPGEICIYIYQSRFYYYDNALGELKEYAFLSYTKLIGWGDDVSVIPNVGDKMYYVNPGSNVDKKILVKTDDGGINVYNGAPGEIYEYDSVYYIYFNGELVDMAPKTRERLIALEKKINLESLEGKKCLFLGDSLTYYGYYIDTLISDLGIIAYNRGNGSSTIATPESESDEATHSFAERVDYARNDTRDARGTQTGMPQIAMDYVFIEGGINDFGRFCNGGIVTSFGNFNDTSTKTFCGALNYVIRKLRGYYPDAIISIIGLIPVDGNGGAFAKWSQYNPDGTQNFTPENKSWFDYNETLKKMAQKYGCNFISLEELGFNPIVADDKTRYYLDGLHPNKLGASKMAKRIEISTSLFISRT